MAERIPTGRAGRLWLIARLDAARRGGELLERKRQLLRREHDRLAQISDERRSAWTEAYAQAQRWALRAAVLGGSTETAMVAGAAAGRATVDVIWRNTMGVVHPEEAHCELPEIAPEELAAGNAAIGPAAAAYRRALEAAVAAAVAQTARERVDAELTATQRRLRAIERHRIPFLERALQALELRLDELEREERVVTRWARERGRARS